MRGATSIEIMNDTTAPTVGQQRLVSPRVGEQIAEAAHYAGIHLTAYEIDADYFHAAKARIARETSQAELFSPQNTKDG